MSEFSSLNLNSMKPKKGGYQKAHKEMRSINFPFPYEDGSRAVMGGKCYRQNIVDLDPHSRICNHTLISSKWPFLYSEMAILYFGK